MSNNNETTYNGWTNYQTWALFTWYGNDLEDKTKELIEYNEETDWNAVYDLVSEFIENIVIDNEMDNDFLKDMLESAIERIDISDITDSLCDDNGIEGR